MKKPSVAVLGAGSFGTAVAIHIATHGFPVSLWSHREAQIEQMISAKANDAYLPGIPFPSGLTPVASLTQCMEETTHQIIAVPSHAFSALLSQIEKPSQGIAWVTKGVDPHTHQLLSSLVSKKWGEDFPFAVIAGPSFAKEVAKSLPTALIIAGQNMPYLHAIRSLLHHQSLRTYLSTDSIGVQWCGAIKNVLAIACGISDGLQYGANAKAAIITRGLAEMTRLGLALGARQETFMGLAGVGDLVLTCTDDQSRNRRFGLELGRGLSVTLAEKKISQVVEGKYNAAQVCTVAAEHQVEMPICEQVNALLKAEISASDAVTKLMQRPAKDE